MNCPYGERCTEAHSEAELEEWKEYFEDWRARLQSETAKEQDCQFAEQLLEKWMNAENPETVVSYYVFRATLYVALLFAMAWCPSVCLSVCYTCIYIMS